MTGLPICIRTISKMRIRWPTRWVTGFNVVPVRINVALAVFAMPNTLFVAPNQVGNSRKRRFHIQFLHKLSYVQSSDALNLTCRLRLISQIHFTSLPNPQFYLSLPDVSQYRINLDALPIKLAFINTPIWPMLEHLKYLASAVPTKVSLR